MKDIREVCDGKWKEQLFTVAIGEHVLNLRGIIISPSEAPTGNYVFTFNIFIPTKYPFEPPAFQFKNKVWHPKICPHRGDICLPELTKDGWEPAFNLNVIGLSIAELLRHPGDFPRERFKWVNKEAGDQFFEDHATYRRVASEWAERENSGYGMVKYEDLRLAEIQSCLVVPQLIPYECHIFCSKANTLKYELIAAVIPSLTIYREMINKVYGSLFKVITSPEFYFDQKEIGIRCNSRDECWNISLSDNMFSKVQTDKVDPRKDSPMQCRITLTCLRPEFTPLLFAEKIEIFDVSKDNVIHSFDIRVNPAALLPTNAATSQLNLKPPTLPLLLCLPLSSDKKVDLTEIIGAKYFKFGVQLLNDETGELIMSIEHKHLKTPENIVREIFMLWIQGKGRDVTWSVLVDCLESIGNVELAGSIKQLYDS